MVLLCLFVAFVPPYLHNNFCSLRKKTKTLVCYLDNTSTSITQRGHIHSFKRVHDNPFTESTTVTALKCHFKEGQSSQLQCLFFLAFLSSLWLSFSHVYWSLYYSFCYHRRFWINEIELFLDSKQIWQGLSYFMLQEFMQTFGFSFIWSHTLWVSLWNSSSDKFKNSKQNSSQSVNSLFTIAHSLHKRGRCNQFHYLNRKA